MLPKIWFKQDPPVLSWVLPLLSRAEACALGPWQWWTDNLKAVTLMLDHIFILYKDSWQIKLQGLCKEDSVKKPLWKGLYNI